MIHAMKTSSILLLTLCVMLAVGSARAQYSGRAPIEAPIKREAKGQPAPAETHDPKGVLRLLPADAVTEHVIDIGKTKLAYTAIAGTLAFYDQSGDQSAAVFYTAYVAKGAPPNRPLTFVFNGGPGAASAYLHLGLVAPRILDLGLDSRDAARAELRDNPDTWLAFTDLVLVDP